MLKKATELVSLRTVEISVLCGHTEFNSVPSEPKPREHHLSQAESWSKCREIADWNDTNQVEEQNCQDGVDESKEEKTLCKNADRKR